ncbi:MAG: DUF1232 domain-containing protein [Bacteroidales bacterium]|nr:DUF1232 domain-containing protein [Bacteroidales bacterium]
MENNTPKDTTEYQKHYSDKGLLEKIGGVFKKAGLKIIYYALLLYYVLKDEDTPSQQKLIIIGALGYFILPVDLVPDFIPVAGFADDAAALLACLKAVGSNVTPKIKAQATQKLSDWFDNVDTTKLGEYDQNYNE